MFAVLQYLQAQSASSLECTHDNKEFKLRNNGLQSPTTNAQLGTRGAPEQNI